MTLVLHAGGLTALSGQRARLDALRRYHQWPPIVASVVLAEALTGDHRKDFPTNRLLRACQIREVDELLARAAARLRTATKRAGRISATDAVVAAIAEAHPNAVVLTSDPRDLKALAAVAPDPFTVAAV